MTDAAVGNRAILGRAIEKANLGLPQGSFEFLDFNNYALSRGNLENKATAISGLEGLDRGTPGGTKYEDSVGYDLKPSSILFDLVAMFGKPASVTDLGTLGKAWLVKIRPDSTQEVRGAT